MGNLLGWGRRVLVQDVEGLGGGVTLMPWCGGGGGWGGAGGGGGGGRWPFAEC